MSKPSGRVSPYWTLSPPRIANARTPPGYRVLHVLVPDSVFNHVKAQAYLSGMRFPEYIARFLEEAWPYNDQRTQDVLTEARNETTANKNLGAAGLEVNG